MPNFEYLLKENISSIKRWDKGGQMGWRRSGQEGAKPLPNRGYYA